MLLSLRRGCLPLRRAFVAYMTITELSNSFPPPGFPKPPSQGRATCPLDLLIGTRASQGPPGALPWPYRQYLDNHCGGAVTGDRAINHLPEPAFRPHWLCRADAAQEALDCDGW